jgi:hypothetical protein
MFVYPIRLASPSFRANSISPKNEFILNNFQSMILGVSTCANLGGLIYLSNRQKDANYPFRICTSLVLNCVVFTMLALSTVWFIVSAEQYLCFTLVSVFLASLAAGFSQNGVFAFVNRFGGTYTQAIMTWVSFSHLGLLIRADHNFFSKGIVVRALLEYCLR